MVLPIQIVSKQLYRKHMF